MSAPMTFFHTFDSPIGALLAVANDQGLLGLHVQTGKHVPLIHQNWQARVDYKLFASLQNQLDAYFAGKRQHFDLPLAAKGTEFQQRVWQALRQIPYGQTRSYSELASALGDAKAVRAVAGANGRNPISIIVPCHRVIGKNGTLTGYAGGLAQKQILLDLERSL